MTSAINYLSINENFPVAGQDNDTQVFRDNFDTIKTSLREASDEITDLQDFTAKLNADNDFELNRLSNPILVNARDKTLDGRGESPITAGPLTIDATNGAYQIYTVGADLTMDFLNFAGDPSNVPVEDVTDSISKVTIELYSDLVDAEEYTVTFSLSGSGATQFKKNGTGFTAVDDTITITLTADSVDNPIIVEFWRHSLDTIYARYLGEFA